MEYLRIFQTQSDFEAAKETLAKPNVGIILENDKTYILTDGSKPVGPNANGHTYVDLGLPSGTLWATCNVGANSPTEYGKYFAWGETEGYYGDEEHDFSWGTYKYSDENGSVFTKYNPQDGLSVLELSDDAAHANMGGDWKMSNSTQMDELFNETDNEWIDDYQGSGINGRVFTSKTNGNTMFIPASCCRLFTSVIGQGYSAYLWSSTFSTDNPSCGVYGYFDSDHFSVDYNSRYSGYCVRGVITPAE